MWLLKSPKDGKPVDVETYIKNDLKNRIILHNLYLTYEKLSYMMQKDMALIIITKLINSSFPKDSDFPLNVCNPTIIYTLSKNEIELLLSKDYDDRFNQLTNFHNMADKIQYIETEVDKDSANDNIITSIKDFTWREYEPVILIKDFFDDNMKMLKGLLHHDKTLDGYNKLLKDVYTDQQKLAKSIFTETDEEDKIGLLRIYQTIKSFVLHEERELRKMFLDSEYYKYLNDEYPLFKDDLELLLSNDKEAYICINNDLTLHWNEEKYGKGCFGQYFIFLNNNKGNMKWSKLKEIFPQFKDEKMENISRGESQEVMNLLVKTPSFNKLYGANEIKGRFRNSKSEIVKRKKALHK
jgi:hypothetical protein